MQLKRILATVMMAAVLVISATACGNGKDSGNSSTNSEVSNAEVSLSSTAGAGYSSDNDTKVKQMLEKVTFNGEPLTIPYKASDLGEGFTFREDVNTYTIKGRESNVTEIMCGNDHLYAVGLYQYNENQTIDDFVAYTIGYSTLDGEKYKSVLCIDGIDGNSTMDEVLEVFGEPTVSEYSDGYVYYYEIDDDRFISFLGTDDNKISQMTICNKPEK